MAEVELIEAVNQIPSAELHHYVDRWFWEVHFLETE